MKIRITNDGNQQDINDIFEMLKEYNLAHLDGVDKVPLGVFYEEDNKKLAGLTGDTFGNWLCISYVVVSKELRGKHIGSELLKAAEDEAVKRGCKYAFVDTFSFQAPEFYTKHGYKEVFALEEYPVSGKRHYYIKELV